MNILTTLNVALAQGLTGVTPPAGTASGGLIDSIQFILNGALILAALIAVIFIIVGGVRYITSQGEDGAITEAKNTILYAVIGLIAIGLAAALVNFVVGIIQGA